MKTALLLTNSAETQRLLTEILGQRTNFVLLPLPVEPTREKFDALFATWMRLADAVILDAASLGETSRWALESLAAARIEERQAIVVRATAVQKSLYPLQPGWLAVSDTDSPEQLRQSLGTFFELRDAQAKLKHADAVMARQRHSAAPQAGSPPAGWRANGVPQVAQPSSPPFESYRYRAALKNIAQLLSRRPDEQTLWEGFLDIVRELLGVGKLAIFTQPRRADWASNEISGAPTGFSVAAATGIARDITGALQLTLDAGIGRYLATEARILRRSQLLDPLTLDHDPQMAREFELLGTEVAVPMFDDDRLLGVLTFSGKITGEALTHEELELAWHLLSQLAQAIRTRHLLDQVAAQERLLSEVLANVQSGVVVASQDGRILNINRRARQLLELGSQELVGQSLSRLPSRVADVLFEALKTGMEIHQREVTLPRTNRPLGVSATRFATTLGGAGAGQGHGAAVALIEDLTQAKLQQARLRELQDKEFFTRLASRLSHELKNSLVSIKIFAQLLPERYSEKEFREQFSTTVANEVNRVDVLVNNLTFFAHPLVLVCEELVLSELIEACVKNVTQEFARKQLAHIVAVGEKPPEPSGVPVVTVKKNFGHKFARLEGDRIRLMQAFEHVLRNAVQSSPRGGRLSIATSDAPASDFPGGKLPPGGAVKIEWQDTGEGIALEDLKRVTEPFVTTRNVGVGLGLTIVKKIVERHGGRLEIDSLLGRGTTVVMWLPLKAQPHPEDELLAQISNKQQGSAEPRGDQDEAKTLNRLARGLDAEQGRL